MPNEDKKRRSTEYKTTSSATQAKSPRAAGDKPAEQANKRTATASLVRARKMPQRQTGEQRKIQQMIGQRIRIEQRREVDPDAAVRLQKAMAQTGMGSRRDMEAAIAAGRVTVNGVVATLGTKVVATDRVHIDKKTVFLKWDVQLPRIIIYHKQEGELVSRDDPQGRATVFERLPRIRSSKWIAIGRLDYNTSGLLIFTTDGDLAHKMTHPRFQIEREYAVRVLGGLTIEQQKELIDGIQLEDGPARVKALRDDGGEGHNHWYRLTIQEGRNREVRRLFEHFELTVSRLIRVRFGSLHLPPRLKRGQWVELPISEVQAVLSWVNGQAEAANVAQESDYFEE